MYFINFILFENSHRSHITKTHSSKLISKTQKQNLKTQWSKQNSKGKFVHSQNLTLPSISNPKSIHTYIISMYLYTHLQRYKYATLYAFQLQILNSPFLNRIR